MRILTLFSTLLFPSLVLAQQPGDIIVTEIGNGGTKRALYAGGDYIDLLVTAEKGTSMAGWYLTDLSSPNGTPKETEGSIRFSDKEGSVFRSVLPQGTHVVVCFGGEDVLYGKEKLSEATTLSDNETRIVVFAIEGSKHVEIVAGKVSFTGKDNVAIISAWKKSACIEALTWSGSSSWEGCSTTFLDSSAIENGKICYLAVEGTTKTEMLAKAKLDPSNWVSTAEIERATPGWVNPSPPVKEKE